jgi:hypothetical protein
MRRTLYSRSATLMSLPVLEKRLLRSFSAVPHLPVIQLRACLVLLDEPDRLFRGHLAEHERAGKVLLGHAGHIPRHIEPGHPGPGPFIHIDPSMAVAAADLIFGGPKLYVPFAEVDPPALEEPFLHRPFGGEQYVLDLVD